MNYDEAAKKVAGTKTKDNFMVFTFQYDTKILLPHKDGVALLASMANAELLKDGYRDPKRIVGVERDTVSTSAFSYEEYERYKIAALLGLTPDEVKEMQTPQPKQEQTA